jgi:Carbohydrate/starch-binding module (family 21)
MKHLTPGRAALLVVALLLGTAGAVHAQDAQPVKLEYASYNSNRLGYSILGAALVQDLGAAKNVTVVYSTSGFPLRQEQPATYAGDVPDTGGTLERWSFNVPLQPTSSGTTPMVFFAIRYTVNGVTYWDTNQGHYYLLTYPGSIP